MKKILLIVLGLLLLLAVGIWSSWGQTYELVLSEQQLSEKLNEKFPFEKTYLFIIGLRFSNPVLSLEEASNRISFGCDIETNFKMDKPGEEVPGPLKGAARVSGSLRYEPSKASFFLDAPKVEQLDIVGLPPKWLAKANSAAGKAVSEFLQHQPLYKLKPDDVKQAAARLVLRKTLVVGKNLVVTLGIG